MFDNLSERLQGTFKKLRGQARITEENITQALRDVRMALIEADVALPVVKEVIETIKNAAIGQEVSLKLSPDQAFIKTVKSELVRIMGEENSALNLATQPPAVRMPSRSWSNRLPAKPLAATVSMPSPSRSRVRGSYWRIAA